MRYHFHLVGPDDDGILDETGIEATSLEAAKAEALLAVQEILAEQDDASESFCGWQLEVTDALQRVVLAIDLDQGPQRAYAMQPWSAARCGHQILHSLMAAFVCGFVWKDMVQIA
jgi:hypothetical protein